MPLPSTLPIGPLDASRLPKPLAMSPGSTFEPNTLLNASSVSRLFEGRVLGSESVAVRPGGRGSSGDDDLVMCDRYGYVWRATKVEKRGGKDEGEEYALDARPLAHLGAGRPLGFHFDAAGNLLVCRSGGSGLVMLEASAFSPDEKERKKARVITLASAVSIPPTPEKTAEEEKSRRHSPVLYANDLDVSHRTGLVYFTDSVAIPPARNAQGFWDTMQAYVLSLAQGQPTGRLLSYDPASGLTSVVAEGLWFANGVALSPDETWAAVVETNSLRVYKIYVEGPKKGQKEVLIDGLPGYPDGISRAFSSSGSNSGSSSTSQQQQQNQQQDGFWLALVAPPQPVALRLLPWRLGRMLMAWTPERLRPPLKPWGATARLRLKREEEAGGGGGEKGGDDQSAGVEVEGWLLDPEGRALSSTSAVTDAGGDRLFFGNLAGGYVSFVDGASRKLEEAKRERQRRRRRKQGGGNSGGGGGGGDDGDRSEL